MWKQANGTTVKLLAIVGVVGLTILMLILLNWLADVLLDFQSSDITKAFVTLFTLLVGGSAGVKYVGGLEVTKKGDASDG
jgi:apolipoprotein N-acyltransferase